MMEHAIEAMVVEALIEIEADEMIEELEEQNIRLVFRSLIGSYKLVPDWLKFLSQRSNWKTILGKSNRQKWQKDGINWPTMI